MPDQWFEPYTPVQINSGTPKLEIDFSDQAITATLTGFRQLRRAIIDASSIIYLTKAGFYAPVAHTLMLFSLPGILVEVGFPVPVLLIAPPLPTAPNDENLLAAAAARQLPVISEDKRVLLGAQRADLPFYNALMLLNFLLFRNEIDRRRFDEYLAQLKQCARYHPRVWRFGEKVCTAVLNHPSGDLL